MGSSNVSGGTLCCIVRDADGQQYLLSADHVFAGDVGTPVLQPGPVDGGTSDDAVAEIARVVRPIRDQTNPVGAALARVLPGVQVSQEIPGAGPILGIATAQLGDRLHIIGRTSGIAQGTVLQVDVTVNIGLGEAIYRFGGLILTEPMSTGGDSGAPVLNEANQLVGYVYGGSSSATLIMPIVPVLRALNVELVP